MDELYQIRHHNQGQKPAGQFDVLLVENLKEPQKALEDFKQVLITILENPDLDPTSEDWNTLLPSNLIAITQQFEDEDYVKDDSVTSLTSLIKDVRNKVLKQWTWHSSQLKGNGFEVYFEGIFRIRYHCHLRFLGIPATHISTLRNGVRYPIKLRNDVIVYKNLARY